MLKRANHADDREVERQRGGCPAQNGAESRKKKFTREDYTVGWVCPLEVELIAALEMLDEEHEPLPQPPTDHNHYHLGSVAGHTVVIAGLWQAGNSPATAVVIQMRITGYIDGDPAFLSLQPLWSQRPSMLGIQRRMSNDKGLSSQFGPRDPAFTSVVSASDTA
ncbi:hypothetical protein Asppvi_005281 [Aspergillus pseudoviridinutans]|uniref:Uncharacterized protein n=1 Tax=Aspergillus pseudoviridinutans TaxID=1517512 RepID=A0A9P3EUT5_9EURO|nr:uncharacterized protein Asppvi_005281 [Aspergillus pseudoviridinutans]GIJ86393.1 hypothetical protein Asppvi_005281 [Aspergillus pseudoviridinutans]